MNAQTSIAKEIVAGMKAAGIDLVASLPDQWLGPLIDECESDPDIEHVKLAREDDGVGLCFGAYLGGRKAALVCQNAGVLLSANVLGALAYHHQIPFLVLASYRGGIDDNHYYQMYKGRVTEGVLDGLGIPYRVLTQRRELGAVAQAGRQCQISRMPTVLLMRKSALLDTRGGAAS